MDYCLMQSRNHCDPGTVMHSVPEKGVFVLCKDGVTCQLAVTGQR